jgi:hypothetical protein
MIDFRNSLEVIYSDNMGNFFNYKNKACDFSRDDFEVTLDTDETLYVGFYKPFNSVYVDSITPNSATGTVIGKYWDGTTFSVMEGYSDETLNLTRSGFITWERNQDTEQPTVVNGLTKYWYKFTTDVKTSAIKFNALNLLFCDDQTLKNKFNKILSDEFLDGETTHNKVHATCRDEIVETFRRQGYTKYNASVLKSSVKDTIGILSITAWDLHDIFEVKEASAYLALSKIFFDFSDKADDIWMIKSKEYMGRYEENMNLAKVSLDLDDDGIVEPQENLAVSKNRYISR